MKPVKQPEKGQSLSETPTKWTLQRENISAPVTNKQAKVLHGLIRKLEGLHNALDLKVHKFEEATKLAFVKLDNMIQLDPGVKFQRRFKQAFHHAAVCHVDSCSHFKDDDPAHMWPSKGPKPAGG